ncbi:phosphate transport system permease protein [Marinobacterium iners DSM 11526]|uniref:Phosphate transport system permease protein PstA n=2 Tax=Oceanospirillaceae TaxID=135620 RepID=A0A1H4DIF3_9GAMM|nr:phosphate transport system permease protein [Marinobacterium iners DSM 11526]
MRSDNRLMRWFHTDTPWVWLNAGAVALCLLTLLGILLLISIQGLAHFWPKGLVQAEVTADSQSRRVIGAVIRHEHVSVRQLQEAGLSLDSEQAEVQRTLIHSGNREFSDSDYFWVLDNALSDRHYPDHLAVFERTRWGQLYGYLRGLSENGTLLQQGPDIDQDMLWREFEQRRQRTEALQQEIDRIESNMLGQINRTLEQLRLEQRRLELLGPLKVPQLEVLARERADLEQDYHLLQKRLTRLQQQVTRDHFHVEVADGRVLEFAMVDVIRAYRPNGMSLVDRLEHFGIKLWEFLSDSPREGNTEGGVFPALFGTVLMVLLMSLLVTPFGVLAAVYLHEYAYQGRLTRIIRIAVNNLAGVPSIVYGIFGLGFFVYFLGGSIDALFFPEALPAPTFGTGGLLWASATLALLTLPVVIVATEEGLRTIPSSLREGALALGATRAETLWRVVLPMASPAMMTGVILAIARAAGEVAPLMLVGVVKLVPQLPVDGHFPYLHLDQKFMHLGFHIYDVGFHSANTEAAQPLVYATALLLLLVILLLNLSAILMRNHLRARFRTLEPEL